MAKIRIIAHVMHETELSAALTKIQWSEQNFTPAFVTGLIDEEDIAKLEELGIIVQRVVPAEETDIAKAVSTNKIRVSLRPFPIDQPPTQSAGYLEGVSDPISGRPGSQRYYHIRSKGPLFESEKSDLRGLNVEIIESLPNTDFIAKISTESIDKIRTLPWVAQAVDVPGQDSLPFALEVSQARVGPVMATGLVTYDVIVRESAALVSVENWMTTKGVQIIGRGRSKLRIVLPEGSDLQDEIAFLPEVGELEPWIPPKLHNSRARLLMSLDSTSNPGTIPFPLDGAGEIVGVADTGLDQAHQDFQNRIGPVVALGRPNIADDPHGHGTHVAGSAVGDGAASGGQHKGTAPAAQLYFQSLLDNKGELGGLPVDLHDLFDPAYQAGVRIHNNSWGAVAQGSYRSSSREVDQFVHDHRDILIVISAGNDGTAASPPPPLNRRVQPGFVNWTSIGAPASAKNALCVGASRSDRNTGGYSTLTYGQAWPNEFPTNPMHSETVSGDSEAMAGFSSRGPTDDYRIKPDVVAPGTDILSCKSSIAPLSNFAGPMLNGGTDYAFDCGTSMAAPLVSGCAALVRQYYRQSENHVPSAALLKATLINGTRWLRAADAIADHPHQPNFHQGFGAIDMQNSIPVLGAPTNRPTVGCFDLKFVDNWNDANRHFKSTGERHRYQFSTARPADLRFCLVFTDLPGRALQNNLNLFLQMLPFASRKWIGNQDLPFSLGVPDTTNNVEVIRLVNTQPADYLIQITAQNLPTLSPHQDYALVVTSTQPILNWTVKN